MDVVRLDLGQYEIVYESIPGGQIICVAKILKYHTESMSLILSIIIILLHATLMTVSLDDIAEIIYLHHPDAKGYESKNSIYRYIHRNIGQYRGRNIKNAVVTKLTIELYKRKVAELQLKIAKCKEAIKDLNAQKRSCFRKGFQACQQNYIKYNGAISHAIYNQVTTLQYKHLLAQSIQYARATPGGVSQPIHLLNFNAGTLIISKPV